jgi:hypothetical protein
MNLTPFAAGLGLVLALGAVSAQAQTMEEMRLAAVGAP